MSPTNDLNSNGPEGESRLETQSPNEHLSDDINVQQLERSHPWLHKLTDYDLHELRKRGNSDARIAARKYETATSAARMQACGFSWARAQHVPALLIPSYDVEGEVQYFQCKLRPDKVRLDENGDPKKYEVAFGTKHKLDVPPGITDRLQDVSQDLYICEGIPKAESVAAQGRAAVAVFGIWCWTENTEVSFDGIPLEGRRVNIVPDADYATNEQVKNGTKGLSQLVLRAGAASTYRLSVPQVDGDEHTGIDDYLGAGNTMDAIDASGKRLGRAYLIAEDYSDAWNAEVFADETSGLIYYSPKTKRLAWDEAQGTWLTGNDAMPIVQTSILETVRRMREVRAPQLAGEAQRQSLRKHSIKSEQAERLSAIERLSRFARESYLTDKQYDDKFDQRLYLLPVQNGTIELETGRCRPHCYEDYLTKQAPVIYREGATCLRWLAFIDQIMCGDEEMVSFMQRLVGYCLSGYTNERVFPVFYGLGNNGKTTFFETLRKLHGPGYAYKLPTAVLKKVGSGYGGGSKPQPEIVALDGMRFTWSVETGQQDRLNEDLVKALTGGDSITERGLYVGPTTFLPQFKLILGTNHRPIITDTSNAMWNRVLLIGFDASFTGTEDDQTLGAQLQSDEALSGILNWALDGYRMWREDGLQVPEAVKAATIAYRESMDPVHSFLDERLVAADDTTTLYADIRQAYEAWSRERGYAVLSDVKFGERLRLKFERGQSGGGQRRYQCRIREPITLPVRDGV